MSSSDHISLPDPNAIKVRTKKESLRLALVIALVVAFFFSSVFAAMLVVIHTSNMAQLQTRREGFIQYCNDQNKRNVNTTRFFHRYVREYEKKHSLTTVQKKQIQGQIQANLTLINDLQPIQACRARAVELYPSSSVGDFLQFP